MGPYLCRGEVWRLWYNNEMRMRALEDTKRETDYLARGHGNPLKLLECDDTVVKGQKTKPRERAVSNVAHRRTQRDGLVMV